MFRDILPSRVDFDSAPLFRCMDILPFDRVKQIGGDGEQPVEFVIRPEEPEWDAFSLSARELAQAGDIACLAAKKPEPRILSADDFAARYEINPAHAGQYRSRDTLRALRVVDENARLVVGEGGFPVLKEIIKCGGMACRAEADLPQGSFYRAFGYSGVARRLCVIPPQEFRMGFVREAANGSQVVLTESMRSQLRWAFLNGEKAHVLDLVQYMSNRHLWADSDRLTRKRVLLWMPEIMAHIGDGFPQRKLRAWAHPRRQIQYTP